MKKVLMVLTFIFVFLPTISSAVPITHGFIYADRIFSMPRGNFSFGGSDFQVSGRFSNVGVGSGAGLYTPHSDLDISAMMVGTSFGSGTYASTTASTTVRWGDLNAMGGTMFNITGPKIPIGTTAGVYTGNFSFTGFMCGTLGIGGSPYPCDANLPILEGVGVVSAILYEEPVLGGAPRFSFREATYTFTNPTATPEPSTMFLLGTGLVGIAGWGRKKFNKKNQ